MNTGDYMLSVSPLTPYLDDFNRDHLLKTLFIIVLACMILGVMSVVWMSKLGNLPAQWAHLASSTSFPFFVIFCFVCIFALVFFRDGYNVRSQIFMLEANKKAKQMMLPEEIFSEFLDHAEDFLHARHQARTCLFYAGQCFFTALVLPFIFSFIPTPLYVKNWITSLSLLSAAISLSFLLGAQLKGMRQHKSLSGAFSVLRKFATV